MDDRDSGTSNALQPGAGHTPGYGINDSTGSYVESTLTESCRTNTSVRLGLKPGKENVRVVARCALIACMASFVSGMTGGFSSPTLLELGNDTITKYPAQLFSPSDQVLPSVFGVSH